MKNPLTPAGIEPATFRFVAQHLNQGGRCVRLTTYHHPVPLSRNLGNLTSWNPLGLSRSVMGLIYLDFYFISSLMIHFTPYIIFLILNSVILLHPAAFFIHNNPLCVQKFLCPSLLSQTTDLCEWPVLRLETQKLFLSRDAPAK